VTLADPRAYLKQHAVPYRIQSRGTLRSCTRRVPCRRPVTDARLPPRDPAGAASLPWVSVISTTMSSSACTSTRNVYLLAAETERRAEDERPRRSCRTPERRRKRSTPRGVTPHGRHHGGQHGQRKHTQYEPVVDADRRNDRHRGHAGGRGQDDPPVAAARRTRTSSVIAHRLSGTTRSGYSSRMAPSSCCRQQDRPARRGAVPQPRPRVDLQGVQSGKGAPQIGRAARQKHHEGRDHHG